MMTKDNNAASSTPGLVSVSTQAAVLVTLPTTMTTADMGTRIMHGAAVKEEADDDLNATLAVGASGSASFSNGNPCASGAGPFMTHRTLHHWHQSSHAHHRNGHADMHL